MLKIIYIGNGNSSVVLLNNEVVRIGAISLDDLAREILSKSLFKDNIIVEKDSFIVLTISALLGNPSLSELVNSLDNGNMFISDTKEIQLSYNELCDKLKVFLQSTEESFIESKNKGNF